MLQTKQHGTKNKRSRNSFLRALVAPAGGRGRTRLSPPLAIGGLIVLTGAALLATRPNNAQNLPSATKLPAPAATGRSNNGASLVVASNVTNGNTTAVRRDVGFYTGDVRATMFSEPQPYVAPVAAPAATKKSSGPPSMPSLPSLPINPFEGWAYTGTATIGDSVVAILENSSTKDSQFVHVGDKFMEAKVTSITDRGVTLSSEDKPVLLAMSDTVNVTPLDKSAAYMTATPQQVQQGQPMDPATMALLALAAQNGGGGRNRGGGGFGGGGNGFGGGGNRGRGGNGFGGGGNGGGGNGGGGNGYGGGGNGAAYGGGGGGRGNRGGGFNNN